MTPKMIAALADAACAMHYGGLVKTRAGWISSRPGLEYFGTHSFASVNALIDRGLLQQWAKGEVVHVTQAGQRALDEERETLQRSHA